MIAMLKDISVLSKFAVLGAAAGGFYVLAIVGGGLSKEWSEEANLVGRFYPESLWPRSLPKKDPVTGKCHGERPRRAAERSCVR